MLATLDLTKSLPQQDYTKKLVENQLKAAQPGLPVVCPKTHLDRCLRRLGCGWKRRGD